MDAKPPVNKIRVQIVDCHQITLWGICQLLTQDERYDICATANNGQEALQHAIETKPDVIILDPQLDNEDGVKLISTLIQKTKSKIIVFTGVQNSGIMDSFILQGARGIINKIEPIETILKTVEEIYRGKLRLNHNTATRIIQKITSEQEKLGRLSTKEEKVTRIIQGHPEKTQKEISEILHISEHTLRNHLASIYHKLGVRNRMELFVFCGKFQKTEDPALHPRRRSTDFLEP